VNVAADNSNAVALVIPTEYDILLCFERRQQRDDALVVLRAVYRRMSDGELPLRQVRDIRANQYQMEKPPGWQLQRIPQRTRAHLRKALETIERQEEERHEATRAIEAQLEETHREEREIKIKEAQAVRAKLTEAESRLARTHNELEALRAEIARTKTRREELEAQLDGRPSSAADAKDQRIRELNDAVERLQAAQAQVTAERGTIDKMKREGDFLSVDVRRPRSALDDFDGDAEVFAHRVTNGRSLHEQAVVEVLQRQLLAKEKELADLRDKARDVASLKAQLQRRNDELQRLEAMSPRRPEAAARPYNAESVSPAASPSRRYDPTVDVGVVSDAVAVDDDGDVIHSGPWPRARDVATRSVGEVSYRLPSRMSEFTTDPRFNLPFVHVPAELRENFSALEDTAIYFFGLATKQNKRGRNQRRVVVCGDRSLYVANTSGHVNRCVWLKAIREVVLSANGGVACKIDGRGEYDLALRFEVSPSDAETFVGTLQRLSAFHRTDPPLQVTRLPQLPVSDLRLEKPPTFEFRIHPLVPRSKLFAALQELAKATAEQRAQLYEAKDRETLEVVERLKNEMRVEVNQRREREFAVLRQQIALLESAVRDTEGEVRSLRRSIHEHSCAASPRPSVSRDVSRPMEDLPGASFWVPTDPVVMESTFDVLCLRFVGDVVVTGHANGLVCAWDVTSARLSRTLRNGHTARVEALDFDGHSIISGGFEGAIIRWDVHTSEREKTIRNAHRGRVNSLLFDPLHLFSAGSDALIHIWDAQSFKHEKTLTGHKSSVTGVAVDGNTLASCEWGWLFVWDIDRGVVLKALRDEVGGIAAMDFRGKAAITGGAGGRIVLWDTHTGESEALDGHQDDVTHVQLADEGHAVTSSLDHTVRTWDLARRKHLAVFVSTAPDEPRTFHMAANRMALGQSRTIKVWTR